MAQKVDVNMPQDLDLTAGWTLRVTAVDATGATVSGVNVSNMSIVADAPLGAVGQLETGPFMLVPGPGDLSGSGGTGTSTMGGSPMPLPPAPALQPPAPSPGPGSGAGVYDQLVGALEPPQFEYSQHKIITTLQAYLAAIRAPQAGYWYDVRGVQIPGVVQARAKVSNWCKFTYDAACSFVGSKYNASGPVPCLEVSGAAYTQHIAQGCTMTNPGGNGIHSQGGTHHCVFDGFHAAGMGADGFIFLGGVYGEMHDLFLRLEAENINTQVGSTSAAWQPHPEPGTGFHGLQWQDSNKGALYNSVVAIYTHDCLHAGGSSLQCGVTAGGAQPNGNTYYVKANNMLFNAQHQGAGNAVNLWGGPQHDNDFKVIECDNMAGFGMNLGAQTGTLTRVKVEQGSATNTNQNPRFSGESPWMKGHGLVYGSGPFTPKP